MENYKKVEKYLGLDYGRSKIGLALADSETRIAFSYATIGNDANMVENLKKIISHEGIDRVILGKLGHANGQNVSFEAEEVGEKIAKGCAIPVEYQEEMFSTKVAERNLKEKGMKNIKKYDNQEAARVILQGWLDR